MTPTQHANAAYEFLEQSERELALGDKLQASEKLWGAATHALLSIMLAEGTKGGTHREFKETASRLSTTWGDTAVYTGFAIAEKFHANFYNGFMEDYQIEFDKHLVHDFVHRLLGRSNSHAHG